MRGRSYPARALRVRGAPRLSPQGTYVIDRPRPKPELRDGVHGRRGPAQEAHGDAQQLDPGRQAAEEAGGEAGRRATGGGHLDAEAAPALPEPGHAPGPPLAQFRPWRGGPTAGSALEPGCGERGGAVRVWEAGRNLEVTSGTSLGETEEARRGDGPVTQEGAGPEEEAGPRA